MLVGEKGLTCVGGKLFSFFRFMLREASDGCWVMDVGCKVL